MYDDLVWVLDDAQRQRVLALGPELFDDDRGSWALVRSQIHGWRGDSALARAWGETAARELALQLRANPGDGQRHALRSVALAHAGRRTEALAEGQRGMMLLPREKAFGNAEYAEHQFVRVNILVGDKEKALGLLEAKLARPNYLSPGWLRIDPNFAPLRGHPRFERLTAVR